jgi:hypothetical protein
VLLIVRQGALNTKFPSGSWHNTLGWTILFPAGCGLAGPVSVDAIPSTARQPATPLDGETTMVEEFTAHHFYTVIVRQIPYLLESADAEERKHKIAMQLKCLGELGFSPSQDFVTAYELTLDQLSSWTPNEKSEAHLAIQKGPGRPKGRHWKDVGETMRRVRNYVDDYKRNNDGKEPTHRDIAGFLGMSENSWLSMRKDAERQEQEQIDMMIVQQQQMFEWITRSTGGTVREG